MGNAVLNVWIVTTWAQPCGISEYAAYLTEAVEQADTSIRHTPIDNLHPDGVFQRGGELPDLVVLNYQASLLSQWQPAHVQALRDRGVPVLCVFHDTGVPNSEQCKALHAVADAFIVHEPCADLPGALYWRQGVPDWSLAWKYPNPRRPRVGSVGFPFPWKNYDVLCEAAAIAGWSVELIAPGASDEQCSRWEQLGNRHVFIKREFLSREEALARLVGCDATAFLYHTHNTGTSGAIRMGLAARKPVIASKFPFGRQFRDLQEDDLGRRAIRWIEPNLDQVVEALSRVVITPMDTGIVRIAERDSWANLGKKYASLYRSLVA